MQVEAALDFIRDYQQAVSSLDPDYHATVFAALTEKLQDAVLALQMELNQHLDRITHAASVDELPEVRWPLLTSPLRLVCRFALMGPQTLL